MARVSFFAGLVRGAALASLLVAVPVQAEWILPPGQEATFEQVLGGAPLPDCTFATAKIEKSRLVATYTCKGGSQQLVLRHSSLSDGKGLQAGAFWLTPEGPLATALAVRLTSPQAATLRWQDAQPTVGEHPPEAASPTADGAPPPLPPELERRYRATDDAMRGDRPWEMFDEILSLVRTNPHPVLMGRLVVACAGIASHPDGRAKVDALMADAKANPGDPLKQFIAGVAVHYRGHVRGRSREEKTEEYQRALQFLEPIREVYANSPRLWIYLAVSYVRTGQQAKAEDAIGRALQFDEKTDADVYYCEAEVWHKKDPKRALQAIERYQKLMHDQAPSGAWHGPGKAEKVEHMRQVMAAVVAGGPLPAQDMYDPVLQQGGEGVGGALRGGLLAALAVVVALGLGVWFVRRKSAAKSQ